MKKNIKKLVLNKETLSNLQSKQMNAIIGGAALASNGTSSTYSCNGDSCFCPESFLCAPEVPEEQNAASCCKRSCNG